MATARVIFRVPLPGHLNFCQWLPSADDSLCLPATGDLLPSRIWAEMTGLGHPRPVAVDEIPQYLNLEVERLTVEVTAEALKPDLVAFIADRFVRPSKDAPLDEWPMEKVTLEASYEDLGRRVFDTVAAGVTRLVDFARYERGQHWLDTPYFGSPFYLAACSEARVKFDAGPAVPWLPPSRGRVMGPFFVELGRSLTREDWARVGEGGPRRASLISVFLSDSEALLARGHARAAVVECVVALEVAVERMLGSPRVESLREPLPGTAALANLPRLRAKLGMRGALDVLLPLLLDEETLPADLLDSAREAVDLRNNVVHNGQRTVDTAQVRKLVRAIRAVCTRLQAATDLNPPPNNGISGRRQR